METADETFIERLDLLNQIVAEAREALVDIEESTEADSMEDVFDARDKAGAVLTRFIHYVEEIK